MLIWCLQSGAAADPPSAGTNLQTEFFELATAATYDERHVRLGRKKKGGKNGGENG